MRTKIILQKMPVPIVKSWEGKLVFRTSGIFRIYRVVGQGIVLYHDVSLINPTANECLSTGLHGWLMPTGYMPDRAADEQFIEILYQDWYKCNAFLKKGTHGQLKAYDYDVPFVHVKKIDEENNYITLGALEPVQKVLRSPALENEKNEGW